MRFLSTSPTHLLDKGSTAVRFNIWTTVVLVSMLALAGLIVFGLKALIPGDAPRVESPGTAAPAAVVDHAKELRDFKDSMARVRLAGLMYAKDNEGEAPPSAKALIGSYLKAEPVTPAFVAAKAPSSAWLFKGSAVHLDGIEEAACSMINNGVLYAFERAETQFYCYGSKGNYTAVFQNGVSREDTRGYWLVTAAFSLSTVNDIDAVNLRLAGESSAFVKECPTGAHRAPFTAQKSTWLTNPSAGAKYVEQFCIPAVEGNPSAFNMGDTTAKGVNSLSKVISSAGSDWTVFIAGYAIPGCLTSPDKVSVVYAAGVAAGRSDKARLPKGCLPDMERPI